MKHTYSYQSVFLLFHRDVKILLQTHSLRSVVMCFQRSFIVELAICFLTESKRYTGNKKVKVIKR